MSSFHLARKILQGRSEGVNGSIDEIIFQLEWRIKLMQHLVSFWVGSCLYLDFLDDLIVVFVGVDLTLDSTCIEVQHVSYRERKGKAVSGWSDEGKSIDACADGLMGIQVLRMNYPSYLDRIRRSWIEWAPLQKKKRLKV